MSAKIYLNILKFGSFSALLAVLMFSADLFFPYITSKQIYFNILLEILAVFWVGFLVRFPDYRPWRAWSGRDYLSGSLLGFFAVLFLSAVFGVDFNLSFWGDAERMLGVFHLLHFLLFYFILITVFKTEKDWQIFFSVSLAIALIVALKGLSGKAYSTLGNTAYMAAYMIFHIYFALILFFREKSNWRYVYLAVLPIFLLAFKKADISGAFVGLGASFLFLPLGWGLVNKNKKTKKILFSIFTIAILSIILIFANRDKGFLNQIRPLQEISWQKNTFQTRLISWKTALKDFKNHPLLGVGHGNFSLSFDKYFDPTFYNHTRSETYFDRAHNNLIDILSTAGIFGLLAYLSIFVSFFYILWKSYREKTASGEDFVLLSALVVAYFVQNLAVFDSLATYICLMTVLAFAWSLNRERPSLLQKAGEVIEGFSKKGERKDKEIYALVFTSIASLFIIYQFNLEPLRVFAGTIEGQKAFIEKNIQKAYNNYFEILKNNGVLDRDARTSFIRSLNKDKQFLLNVGEPERSEILNFAIEMAEKNLAYNPEDSLNAMYLAEILDLTSLFYREDEEKFYFYSNRALEAVNQSIQSAPGRIPIYYSKARILANRGENQEALETLYYALALNIDYYDSYCQLGNFYLNLNDEEKARKNLSKCVEDGGANLLSAGILKSLAGDFKENDDFENLARVYEVLIRLEPKNAQNFVNLALIYKELDKPEKAIEAARQASAIDKTLTSSTEKFIEELR